MRSGGVQMFDPVDQTSSVYRQSNLQFYQHQQDIARVANKEIVDLATTLKLP